MVTHHWKGISLIMRYIHIYQIFILSPKSIHTFPPKSGEAWRSLLAHLKEREMCFPTHGGSTRVPPNAQRRPKAKCREEEGPKRFKSPSLFSDMNTATGRHRCSRTTNPTDTQHGLESFTAEWLWVSKKPQNLRQHRLLSFLFYESQTWAGSLFPLTSLEKQFHFAGVVRFLK